VADESWWTPQLKSELSQGDVLSPIPIGSPHLPVTYLSKGRVEKGSQVWLQSSKWQPDGDGIGLFLGKGRVIHGLVVSHDCEIDKPSRSARVLIAPISQLDKLEESARQPIIEQKRYSLMPLPGVPQLGDYYADLRCLMWLDRKIVDQNKRIASMSEEGVLRLQAQLIGFFTRKSF